MNDSNMTDEWVRRVVAQNPCVSLNDGNYRTCPVRLCFPHIFEKGEPVEAGKPGFYGASLVIPPIADISILKAGAGEVALAKWPKAAEMKLKSPFLDQGEQVQYGGFEEGGVFLRSVAYENAPRVFDSRMIPVTDKSRVYPGVWAIAIIRFFTYDKGVNKGVSTGLQAVMIVADDKQLGGGGIDPQAAFGGVQIDAEVNPAGMFADPEKAAEKALFG